jgi:hypothetical protein
MYAEAIEVNLLQVRKSDWALMDGAPPGGVLASLQAVFVG